MTENFNDHVFRQRVEKCLEKTRLLLHQTKHLNVPEYVAHQYGDKYLVAEHLTNTAISCFSSSLLRLGLSETDLTKLVSWARSQDVSLRFEMSERCVFIKETQRDVASATRNEVNVTGFAMITGRQITTVTENLYTFTAHYELVAFRGVGDKLDDRIVLQSRKSHQDIVTSSRSSPYPEATNSFHDLNISWLLRCMNNKLMQITFLIDREMKDCHTPSRNLQVLGALRFYRKFKEWVLYVNGYFLYRLFQVQLTHTAANVVRQDLQSINIDDIFVPVVPLMCIGSSVQDSDAREQGIITSDGSAETIIQRASSGPSVMLNAAAVSQLLAEHVRSLDAKCSTLMQLFPNGESHSTPTVSGLDGSQEARSPIISAVEAKLLVILLHLIDVGEHYADGIQHLENLLEQQLVAAVGKTLQASDFTAYMRFHNRQLFKEAFQPRPFSHAVRRTVQHSPEGSFRIEEQTLSGSMSEPIYTSCCSRSAREAAPMQFALNASTNVTFGGDRHLHTWLSHSFSGQQLPKLTLVAQARQFSSFVVLIGRIASASVFEPKYGMIVQNKDEVCIPLNLEHLPTPKEFRDAIESLSPEQQRFAKAYRGMQLEGTLLGVLVLPIKPQLEVVLKLPSDILTKEIRLTQDLMELFIKYQIPSDLLSFDEKLSNGESPTARLAAVKEHVKNMLTVINESKVIEMKDKVKEDAYNNPGFPSDEVSSVKMLALEIAHENQDCMTSMEMCVRKPSLMSSMQSLLYAATPPVNKKSAPNAASSRAAQNAASWMAKGEILGNLKSSNVTNKIVSEIPQCRDSSYACEQADRESAIVTARVEKENPAPSMSASDNMGSDSNGEQQKGNIESSDNASSSSTSASAYAGSGASGDGREVIDFTKYAGLLDRKYEELDLDSALRPTIINPSDKWTKKSTKSLMSEPTTALLTATELNDAKQATFELLDALTRSGALVMESASLHVVIAATHCFDKSLMDTVVQGNVNPIERVERSAVIMATTIHRLPASALLSDMEVQRVLSCSPQLQQLEY
jgi:hypothetical protein